VKTRRAKSVQVDDGLYKILAMPLKPLFGNSLEKVSVTGFDEIRQCGWKFYLSNILRIRNKSVHVSRPFGTAFHTALQGLWKGTSIDFSKAWKAFKKSSVQYDPGDSWETYLEKGLRMVDAVVQTVEGRFQLQSAPEISDVVDLGGVKLSRRVDLVATLDRLKAIGSNGPVIVSGRSILDIKTASRMYSKDKAATGAQLTGYNVPATEKKTRSVLDGKFENVGYLVATKAKDPKVQYVVAPGRTQEEIGDYVNAVKQYVRAAKKGFFPQNKGDHCAYCDYRGLCYRVPGWQENLTVVHRDRSWSQSSDGGNSEKEG